MKNLVVIDACVRQSDSRTLRIAEPIIEALSERYKVIRYDLPGMDIVPLNPGLFEERGLGEIPDWASKAATAIAKADRILIAAPIGHTAHFWGAVYGLLFPLVCNPSIFTHFIAQLGF